MQPYEITKSAEEFGISKESAFSMRIRFLANRVAGYAEDVENSEDATEIEMARQFMLQDVAEIVRLKQAMTRPNRSTDDVTSEQIERARAYPIAQLIDFQRGKAVAWCHDDRNPSLYHGNRTNRAICPVCVESFDSIQVLRTRDGMTFHEAVRALQ